MAIGFRIPWSADVPALTELAPWARDNGFGIIDLGGPDADAVNTVRNAGLEVGTFDLGRTSGLLSPDADVRRANAQSLAETAQRAKDLGLTRAFGVLLPPDSTQSRADSFRCWRESWPPVSAALADAGIALALEGWPGGSPHYPALGVTPETIRAMLAFDTAHGAGALQLNFDPSHLVRLGIDPVRFLSEFGTSVVHAHGKDTAFDAERQYETGRLEPSLNPAVPSFGEGWWRYCIPGEGVVPWPSVAARLSEVGYTGHVSIELEDARYNGSWAGEQRGLTRARHYLSHYFG